MTSLRHNGAPAGGTDTYLDAARACILDVGWRRTTLTEVARRAGVSRMTIYRSYRDMGSLLADLMTREWGVVVGAATRSRPDAGGPVSRLVGAIAATVDALRRNELFVRIVELDPELLLPYLLERRGRSQDQVLALVERELRAGQETGAVRDGHAPTMARALLLAVHGFVLSTHTMVDAAVSEQDLLAELRLLVERLVQP